ncbi:MAG: metallophosphoesterase family protein [Candidatus Heimdallarchaeota archaeon]|nr:metallophosphoesterase family protein [Candidatus Heimdallarchaeota archaeon]MBY8993471.1 metallophosphoesterase family protein [Candidatus Heimdallarchaeota archaeon]
MDKETNDSKTNATSSLMIPGKPAILLNEEKHGKTLVISDLHLGYVYSQNKKGIIIPISKQAEEDLLELIKQQKPRRVIIVGDFKDEIFGSSHPIAGRIWNFLQKMLKLTRVTIIKGNHDGKVEELLPKNVEVIASTGLCIKERVSGKTIGLWHGHANPALDVITADITISAHAHPAYTFRESIGTKITEKVWVKAKWRQNNNEQERIHIIIPAFNRYIDGYSVDGKFFNSIVLMRDGIDFNNAEVFTLDGVLIGTIEHLQEARQAFDEEMKEKKK